MINANEIIKSIDQAVEARKNGSDFPHAIINGKEYIIHYYERGPKAPAKHELCIWDTKERSLLQQSFTTMEAAKNAGVERIQKYDQGYICCCGCGEYIKLEDIAGNIFAGQYCKECWENKYRAVEANMNYD